MADLYEYRLDNAALIFPSMLKERQSTIFRLSADIDAPVNISLLQQALDAMMRRCPYYRVQLRRGLFWYYLERNENMPKVEAESRYPCIYLPYKKPEVLPFRVLAYRNRIIFEVAHFLTDGSGALRFLNGLLLEYLRLRGETIDPEGLLIDSNDPVDPGEFEDSFHTHYKKGIPPAKQVSPAFQIKAREEKPPIFHIFEGRVSSTRLKEEASLYNVTIGEYLTALLLDVCLRKMLLEGEKPRPIRAAIPIDLRRMFSSNTMRNFVLTVEPEIDPRLGDFSFEEVIAKVHHFMRLQLDRRMILRQFARNVAGQRNPVFRAVPLILKDPLFRYFYRLFGRSAFTVSFSNLGRVTLPKDMVPFVKGYQFVPPPLTTNTSVTSIAWGDTTSILFGSTIAERSLERDFFARLRKSGIDVQIKTNWR
jgi:hypothetical protein